MATKADEKDMRNAATPERDVESDDVVITQARSYARSPIISILVGESQVEYTAHEAVLVAKCPFFEKCFNSGMAESHSGVVELPEEDCETFDHFIEYIYGGKLNSYTGLDKDSDRVVNATMKDLALAEKFCMFDWHNLVIDRLRKVWQEGYIAPSHVSWVVDHLSETSKLYQLAMAQLAYNTVFDIDNWLTSPGNEEENDHYRRDFDILCTKEGFPVSQFIWDMVKMQKHPKEDVPDPSHQVCKFRVHSEGRICKKAKYPDKKRKREEHDH
ncbi:hypothetical protein H2200_011875 [Cladophialophora chaetospira]|uniref:BTB domain-containing protein n=1 Tax=Cladophialophora chaetospira TaxID=386627 RepID=A0AA38WYW5_9EURO|nr:hypothetical protein H2200_011875 [Cladophialophora chaetospira]